jgi:hypothetical protein
MRQKQVGVVTREGVVYEMHYTCVNGIPDAPARDRCLLILTKHVGI